MRLAERNQSESLFRLTPKHCSLAYFQPLFQPEDQLIRAQAALK
jgi:hypothetical protein